MLNKKLKLLKIEAQAGRSMIEMLGVLAIMAVITVLSIMAYTMAMRNLKMNQVQNDMYVIMQQTRNRFPGKDYLSDNKTPFHSLGGDARAYFNKNFVATGFLKNDKTPFGGYYFVSAGSSNEDGTVITPGKVGSGVVGLAGISPKDCKLIMSHSFPGTSGVLSFQNFDCSTFGDDEHAVMFRFN